MRQFDKPPLSISEQIDLLKRRGLTIQDELRATALLEIISLFRLTPYMRPFQRREDPHHHFVENATLKQVVDLYRFDQKLRILVMDALERVEVAVRAVLGNVMASHYNDAHWYMNSHHFKRWYKHNDLLEAISSKLDNEKKQLQKETKQIEGSRAPLDVKQRRIEHRKRDNYFRFYAVTYCEPKLPPSWAVMEELSFGTLSRLYMGLAKDRDRKMIARRFDVSHKVLGSWLHTLTFIRNICAHHARLWNRELAIPPKLPKAPEWNWPELPRGRPYPQRRLAAVLFILAYLMHQIDPSSHWQRRVEQLLTDYPDVPLSPMGLFVHWQDHPIWKRCRDQE